MRQLRRLGTLVLLIALLPLAGCELAQVTVLIHGFETAQVEGVTFWRDENGTFVKDGRLLFENTEFIGGQEYVHYYFEDATGMRMMEARAPITRSATNPDDVQIDFWYMRLDDVPQLFKVSSFNQAGESQLTVQSKSL